jgi:hypothetical protein
MSSKRKYSIRLLSEAIAILQEKRSRLEFHRESPPITESVETGSKSVVQKPPIKPFSEGVNLPIPKRRRGRPCGVWSEAQRAAHEARKQCAMAKVNSPAVVGILGRSILRKDYENTATIHIQRSFHHVDIR